MLAKRGVTTKTHEKNEAPETPGAPKPLFYKGKRGCKGEKKRGKKKTTSFYRKKQRTAMLCIAFWASRMHFHVFFLRYTRFDT